MKPVFAESSIEQKSLPELRSDVWQTPTRHITFASEIEAEALLFIWAEAVDD